MLETLPHSTLSFSVFQDLYDEDDEVRKPKKARRKMIRTTSMTRVSRSLFCHVELSARQSLTTRITQDVCLFLHNLLRERTHCAPFVQSIRTVVDEHVNDHCGFTGLIIMVFT